MTTKEFKDTRLALGRTQIEMAAMLGISRRMLCYYEAGRGIRESVAILMRKLAQERSTNVSSHITT